MYHQVSSSIFLFSVLIALFLQVKSAQNPAARIQRGMPLLKRKFSVARQGTAIGGPCRLAELGRVWIGQVPGCLPVSLQYTFHYLPLNSKGR
jgi:hypothetical protein